MALAYFKRLFPGRQEYRGLILGLDCSGKTTCLYMMKLNEVITTIPTIGFNIESIAREKSVITFWDIGGGCGGIQPLMRHYFQNTDIMLFLHDVSDQEQIEESIKWISIHLAGIHREDLGVQSGGLCFCVAMTKQDKLPAEKRESIVADQRSLVEKALSEFNSREWLTWKIFDTPGFNALEENYLLPMIDDMIVMLSENQRRTKSKGSNKITDVTNKRPNKAELIKRIEEEVKNDLGPESFWAAFTDAKLETWDHRSHLRAGFMILLQTFQKMESVPEAADLFLDHLQRLRESNSTRFRNTAHRTMTIFWLYQLRSAILAYQTEKRLQVLPRPEDFQEMLLHTPKLMDGQLWNDYYTREVIFTPEAKENWRLPDLQPLHEPPAAKEVTKAQKREQIEQSQNNRLIKFALAVVNRYITEDLRRGLVVKEALDSLQSTTMRLRSQGKSIPPYSETQAYFWIQIVDAACATLRNKSSTSEKQIFNSMPPIDRLSVQSFMVLFDIDASMWKQYYTPKLWEALEGRFEFRNPDIKSLPNIISVPSTNSLNSAAGTWLTQRSSSLPNLEDLTFRARLISKEVSHLPSSVLNPIDSHAKLLLAVYSHVAEAYGSNQHQISSALASTLTELCGPKIPGYTSKSFWLQQVLAAYLRSGQSSRNAHLDSEKKLIADFQDFLRSNVHLSYEDLPLCYYSPEVWSSYEANVMIAVPDKRPLPRGYEEVAEMVDDLPLFS